MTGLREAAQMALEALEHGLPIIEDYGGKEQIQIHHKAIAALYDALREALANEFNPDWDGMAVMVEEQQRMAKRIEELESALAQPERDRGGACVVVDGTSGVFTVPLPGKPGGGGISKSEPPCATGSQCVGNKCERCAVQPQREWQGLTDEERQECLYSDPIFGMAASTFARAIEAKLKEKNGAT